MQAKDASRHLPTQGKLAKVVLTRETKCPAEFQKVRHHISEQIVWVPDHMSQVANCGPETGLNSLTASGPNLAVSAMRVHSDNHPDFD